MKYNIHIPQREAMMISEDLDILDMAIFDFIQYFSQTNSCRKLYDGDIVYFWIAYDLIIDEMPLLKIKTKDAIYRRIQKLVSVDLLTPHTENQKMGKTYFRFGEAFSGLYSDIPSDEKPKGVRMKNRRGTDEKPKGGTDEKSDKEYHHIEDNHKKTIYSVLEFWNSKKIIDHEMGPSIKYQIEKTLKLYTIDQIQEGIKNYAIIFHSPRTYWEHKWTLAEFLSRDKGLAVFLYKSEKDYLSKNSAPFVGKEAEIKKSQDAEKRALHQKQSEEVERQDAKRKQDQILRWYESAPEGLRAQIDAEIAEDFLVKGLKYPVSPDHTKNMLGDSESEIERKNLVISSTIRMATLKIAGKYMQK